MYQVTWFVGNHRSKSEQVGARIVAAFQTSANSIVTRRLKFGLEWPEQFSYDASMALLKKA
jgi:hypothetical protein